MPRPRVLEFEVTVDRAGGARSGLGGSPPPREGEGGGEHLVLAGLVRCTPASLDYPPPRAGPNSKGGGRAQGVVTRRESDGLYAFVAIETTLEVELAPVPDDSGLRELLVNAERGCFVSNSLTAEPQHHWIVNGREIP